MMKQGHDNVNQRSAGRLFGRLEKMVAAGRITDEEAARLRAAAESGDLDAEVGRIRRGHVHAKVEAAVEEGSLTAAEAEKVLEQVENGAHPRVLRTLLRR